MLVLSTAAIGPRHVDRMKDEFPELEFRVFDCLEPAKACFPEADILLTYGEDLTPHHVDELKRLKWVYVISAGVERVPLAELENRGVIITNARGIHATPMAEYTLGMMLAMARHSPEFHENQRSRVWDRTIRVSELSGKTVGIVGTGAIGKEIARKAAAFDMQVIGLNTGGTPEAGFDTVFPSPRLHDLLGQSDYVVICVPLTHQTRGLVGRAELNAMKPAGILINIARGAVVDENELASALREGRIGGACLDVYEKEPLPQSSPLWDLPNTLLTPHISGRSPMYIERAMELFRNNYALFRDGRTDLKNRIWASKGY